MHGLGGSHDDDDNDDDDGWVFIPVQRKWM